MMNSEATMAPVIRIPDPIFERLQAIATPLVDTTATVIEKLLDFYESREKLSPRPSTVPNPVVGVIKEAPPDSPPDLTHTRILAAQFDGQEASSWNELVYLAHRRALPKLGSYEALRSTTISNVVKGQKGDSGFHYLEDVNISIQNVSASEAWLKVLHLARRLGVPVWVNFEWRDKKGAALPGDRRRLSWAPPRSK